MAWSWRYLGGDGEPVDGPAETFPSQADAESWVGQTWQELVGAGVSSVALLEDVGVRLERFVDSNGRADAINEPVAL